ncbi:murein transglycosylase domain-containing protein [Aliarcobacter skirrowii]|uniref:murein transglycosylase domain-containing protein n=1 Tax=Aliarcobacter skirrowii TaxID=28200 RepID=UPI003209DC5F
MKKITLLALFIGLLQAESFQEYKKEQESDFQKRIDSFNSQKNSDLNSFTLYKEKSLKDFEEYKKAQQETFDDFKNEASKLWEVAKMPTAKSLISYTDDKKTRGELDFENERIVIETIASSYEEATKNLKKQLGLLVSVDTDEFNRIDPFEKKLSNIKPKNSIVSSSLKNESILSNVVFGKKPTKKDVNAYTNKNVNPKTIKVQNNPKVPNQKVYSVVVAMPSDTMVKKSKEYESEVTKQGKIREIPKSLIFAIMHSESSFNPKARSHIPAFGLMQIVPSSAGKDVYNFLYKEEKLVSDTYLYNSTNNITMGTAYLHMLYYKYLSRITNDESRLYCAIAAYNTGAGNVARTFSKTTNMANAAPIINSMTPKQVYNKLLKDLPYDETKNYLQKVTARMHSYSEIYGKN